MERQKRISRIVGLFLRNRFSAPTEERVQRWLLEERNEAEKERASFEFWQSLGRQRFGAQPASVRRWVGVAASILIPLMVAAGGIVWRVEMRRAEAERVAVEAAAKAEAARNEPLIFDGASVDEILTVLEERFNVTITADEAFRYRSGEQYTIKFTRNENLEDILSVLRDVIGEFEYTKTGNVISIISQ